MSAGETNWKKKIPIWETHKMNAHKLATKVSTWHLFIEEKQFDT